MLWISECIHIINRKPNYVFCAIFVGLLLQGEGEGCILLGALFQSLFRGYNETRSIYFISSCNQPAWNEPDDSFIHSLFCLTTGPKPPLKRFRHIVRSRASSFKWEYPLLSLPIILCILYNQRDATYTMFFIIISAVHVSGGFSAHHQ